MNKTEKMFSVGVNCWLFAQMPPLAWPSQSLYETLSVHVGFGLMRHSLILVVAGIREPLHLDRGPIYGFTRLHFDDGSLDALLQVHEASVVPLRLRCWNEGIFHPEGIPCAVGAHDILDVHSDGVVDVRGQAAGGLLRKFENNACEDEKSSCV